MNHTALNFELLRNKGTRLTEKPQQDAKSKFYYSLF